MICFPNAKINLGLNIISKRDDGYHNLETIFYPIMIKDALEIIPTNQQHDTFNQSGLPTGTNSDTNLVMKALRLMRQYYHIPYVEVHLLKKIPFGAGIGGGSADASFMLTLLNQMFDLGATTEQLELMAIKLGADCPFFIHNKPILARGIGNLFEKIDLSLKGYHIILIKPDISVSTHDAFAQVVPQIPAMSLLDVVTKPVSQWKGLMKNDFERSIFPKYPLVEQIKNKLYALGALYASMTGSGSAVYGIFENKTDLKHHFNGCYVWEDQLDQ